MVGRNIEGLQPIGSLIEKFYYILKKITCNAMQVFGSEASKLLSNVS